MLPGLRSAALAVAVALVGTHPVARAADAVPATDPPRIGGHFSLTTADGTEVTDRSFEGKWLLLYFGYTFCPDACPTALNTIAEALDEVGPLCRADPADFHHGRSAARHPVGPRTVCEGI